MAQSNNNVITHGLSGMVGDMIVFRQRAGKTIVSKAPKDSKTPPTEEQKKVRQKFQQAIIYGKAAIANTTTKEAYAAAAEAGESAYNVAVADFFNAPEIDQVDVSNYKGKVGDTITVRVTDDFMVESVLVKIENDDTTVVEEGAAVLDANGLDWVFTAKKANASLAGDKITVIAKDTPDNSSSKQTVLS